MAPRVRRCAVAGALLASAGAATPPDAGVARWYTAADALAGALPPPPTVPRWEPTYNMSRSTIVMACNYTGYVDPALALFGIVDM
jgi:hypothetical protein